VVVMNGLDSTKEMLQKSVMDSLFARRGLATLFVDQPGTGEALRLHGLTAVANTEVWASPIVDWLQQRADVDARRHRRHVCCHPAAQAGHRGRSGGADTGLDGVWRGHHHQRPVAARADLMARHAPEQPHEPNPVTPPPPPPPDTRNTTPPGRGGAAHRLQGRGLTPK